MTNGENEIDKLFSRMVRSGLVSTSNYWIEIAAEQSGGELLLSVTDHGPGIPASELTNIFDRMYRIEQRVYSGADGMGLGLYICQRLVAAHGGRIWAESTVGQGSTIKFTLPITGVPRSAKQAARIPAAK